MATYTLAQVVFTAAQEAGLDRKLFVHNAGRVTSGLPTQTKQQYLDGLVAEFPIRFVAEFRDDFKDRCSLAIQSATVSNLMVVASSLGIDINPYD